MGRVSDAMWRAENHVDETTGTSTDEVPFGSSEGPFIASEDGGFVSQHAQAFVSATDDGGFVSGQDEEKDDVALYVFNPSERKAPSSKVPAQRLPSGPIERVHADTGPEQEIRIAVVLETMFRHRWLMAVVVGICVAGAVAYNRVAVPIFEARARLIIEPSSAEVAPFRGALNEDQGRVDYYVTQIEVLRSRAVIGRTLERLNLLRGDQKAQVDQVSAVLATLGVAPVRSDMGESRVLNVSYRSPDPVRAAQIVNGVTQTYVDQNLESRRQGSRAAYESLNQHLAELRNDVTATQGAVQRYREQKDSVSLGDQQNIVGQKLAQLNAAVTSARMERLDKQTLYEQLKKIRQSGAPLDTFSPILSNNFVQGLKAEVAQLQKEKAQLSERLGDAHPDMIKVNMSIAGAERRLENEIAKIVEGIENDYKAAEAREKAMSDALEGQKREVLALSQKSIGFSALQRDAASTQQMFDTVLQRVKETELSGELQTNNAKILDTAEIPRVPIWPRKQLNLIGAVLGGTFLAIVLAFTRERLNPRLTKRDDISVALGLPVLGTAPKINRLKVRAALDTLPPAFQEAVRALRTRILLSPIGGAARALVVTSTNAGEGKTVISSSLAASMAMAGRRVLLVDADLRRPQLHQMFSIPMSPGLSDLLMRGVKPSDAVVESSVPGLYLLSAGTQIPNPSQALDNQRLTQLIQGFGDDFDVVVFDCPPVMPVADAAIVANAASSVLFVVGSGTTSRGDAQVAIDRLSAVQVQVVGVVLNKARPDSASAYHYQPSLTEHTA